jgi:hypothetical protein
MKPSTTLVALSAAILLGSVIGYFVSLPRGTAPLADLDRLVRKEADKNLSPITFSSFYTPIKNEVELRFDGKIALVDGEVCSNENALPAIKRAKDQKGSRYLVVIGGERDSFGSLVEAVDQYRTLGFSGIVLMANQQWVDDGYHWPHSAWLHSP